MMNKEKFIIPLIEVVNIKDDIICTSPFDDSTGGGEEPEPGELDPFGNN